MSNILIRPARVTDIIDGDTCDIECNMGMGIYYRVTCRLLGIDTAETYGVSHDSEEYEDGVEQTEFVRQWIATGRQQSDRSHPFTAFIEGEGKYGRTLAEIERPDGEALGDALIDEFGDSVEN